MIDTVPNVLVSVQLGVPPTLVAAAGTVSDPIVVRQVGSPSTLRTFAVGVVVALLSALAGHLSSNLQGRRERGHVEHMAALELHRDALRGLRTLLAELRAVQESVTAGDGVDVTSLRSAAYGTDVGGRLDRAAGHRSGRLQHAAHRHDARH